MSRLLGRSVCIGAVIALLPALVAAGAVRATASPTDPNPGIRNFLTGVKALSPTDVWAVGYYCAANCAGNSQTDQTLIEHWDGTAWTQVASPDPSGWLDRLFAVTATSATDVWAVGYYCAANCLSANEVERTLVLHWNGTSWSQVTSPNPFSDELTAVTATSATDAWAVGYYCTAGCLAAGGTQGTLIEQWNGTAWSSVRSPNPGPKGNTENILSGAGATGTGDAWAVGSYCTSQCLTPSQTFRNLIEHWNGTAWSKVTAPSPAGGPNLFTNLYALSADSPTDAWAVGYHDSNTATKSMILHWNGTAWTEATSPNPGDPVLLYGVSSRSPTDAWAAGQYMSSTNFLWHTLILHWNGSAWAKVPSPTPVPAPNLQGRLLSQVSADSATDAWAVGSYCTANCANNNETDATLILHWSGTRWSLS